MTSLGDRGLRALIGRTAGDLPAALDAARRAIGSSHAAAPDLRRAAWLMAAAGDLPGAEQALDRARLDPSDGGEAWFAIGLLHLARDRHAAARAAFLEAAAARHPAGAVREAKTAALLAYRPADDRYAALGIGILYDEFSHDFCCFAVPRTIVPAERQHYGYCMERACSYLGHTEAGAALLARDRSLNGESAWFHVSQGHLHWLRGAREQADRHYGAARACALDAGTKPYHYNCGTMVWLPAAQARALIPDDSQAQSAGRQDGAAPPGRPPTLVIVLGCDARYFVFLPKLLVSIVAAHRASGVDRAIAVHVHLADAPPDQVAFLRQAAQAIAAAAPLISLGVSTASTSHKDPDWYTCLRFLVLADALAFYRCGAVALDVDCTLKPDFFTRAAELSAYDFGFRMYSYDADFRQVGDEPWSIGAHPTYVGDTPAGRRFAGFLHAYIDTAYDPALPTNWTIDQCALAQGYDLIVRPDPASRVLNLAHLPPGYRLPQEDGGKQAFLHAGGLVTPDNFVAHLAAACAGAPAHQA